jgi:DNA topoisomerase-1
LQPQIKNEMNKNLVIVESPAKAKTIEKFLGSDYTVKSSYGHIRDLKKKSFSINENTFEPEYEIPEDKEHVVSELRKLAKNAQTVWLASDEDREGEAISWHLKEVLGLSDETKRIVFHEITKNAILEAIQHPRTIDMSLVAAQQARRVLDRIVGFKLSPILWRKVKPALSAGRVQSVAVRLVVEKEREVQAFKSESYWRVVAQLQTAKGESVPAELVQRVRTEEEADALLQQLQGARFTVSDIQKKPTKRTPAPPFTTSTLQQEAAHKLGMTVSQTMTVAQRLYENGLITYMRTDSVNLSALCLAASKQYITEEMGAKYSKTRQYHTSSKGAQEAHEAIRPTYMERTAIDGTNQEKRLYDLIWKRTIASQMADAEVEKTVVTVDGGNSTFQAQGEVMTFDGFMKVYHATVDEQVESESEGMLPAMRVGEELQRITVVATEKYATGPLRYNEASLVKKLEELGIGRPSTYATTITTIQQREYVQRGDKKGEEKPYAILTLKGEKISRAQKKIVIGAEKNKLMPTDIGIVVNDYLMENFPQIMDYNFTAQVEKGFDDVASGKKKWDGLIKSFYKDFNPLVEETLHTHTEHKVGEKVLGKDPATGEPVMVKIGRFGPVVQIGSAESDKKPRFAQLGRGQSMETLTLEDALELFKLPRTLGEYEGQTVMLGSGRYGPYVQYGKQYVSMPKGSDPMNFSFDEAVALIEEKKQADEKRHLKHFEEEPGLEVMNGRYGPYIAYKGKNYRLTKAQAAKADQLTLEDCLKIVGA